MTCVTFRQAMFKQARLFLLVTPLLVGVTVGYAADKFKPVQVSWQNARPIAFQPLSSANIPAQHANLVFFREKDNQDAQTAVNIGINGKYQGSLRGGNYTNIQVCAGAVAVSAKPTSDKTNNLTTNTQTYYLSAKQNHYFTVQVDNHQQVTLSVLTEKQALPMLQGKLLQSNTVSRVEKNCEPQVKEEPFNEGQIPMILAQNQSYNNLTEAVSLNLKVLYKNSGVAITQNQLGEVAYVASFMYKYPESTAIIEGHTDSVGDKAKNLALSQARADAIKAILVDTYHIDASRLAAVGYGEDYPVADNSTAEGRQKNRRVIAVIIGVKKVGVD